MNRTLHNIIQSLKKDCGAHFTYNLGVSFMRAGALLIAAATVLFICSRIRFPVHMTYVGETDAQLKGYWCVWDSPLDIDWPNDMFTDFRYYLCLKFELSGEVHDVENYVYEETFDRFAEKDLDSVTHMNIYKTDERHGFYYLSEKDAAGAAEEARCALPPKKSSGAFWLLLLSVPAILIGLHEERLGMKYPRSDVPLEISGLPVPAEGSGQEYAPDTDTLTDNADAEPQEKERKED